MNQSKTPSARSGGDVSGVFAAGGLLAALGLSSCCVLPLVLFSIGVSGAWIGAFTALGPYEPLFLVAAVGCLLAGFTLVYRTPGGCESNGSCAAPPSRRLAKVALWAAALLVLAAIIVPRAAPLFLTA